MVHPPLEIRFENLDLKNECKLLHHYTGQCRRHATFPYDRLISKKNNVKLPAP
jgi:hypothetical protein